MKNNIKIKFLLIVLFFLITAVFFVQNSYSYFDLLETNDNVSINIGMWDRFDEFNNIKEYVEVNYNEKSDVILESIGTISDDGNLILDHLYEDYSKSELEEIVDLISDFMDNFLTHDKNGEIIYPEESKVLPVELPQFNNMLPGESIQVKQVIHTANHSTDIYWSPMTLQITLESLSGQDVSDYLIEVLIDDTPFAIDNPFVYGYSLGDHMSWNTYSITKTQISPRKLTKVIDSLTTTRTVYKPNSNNEYVPAYFKHHYELITATGSWNRFPEGPNYYIGGPRNSAYGLRQQFDEVKKSPVSGVMLNGKPDGTKVELRIDFPNRYPRDASDLPVLPIMIICSRGVQVDEYDNELPNQSTLPADVKVTLRVVGRDLWFR